jgi:1-phosphatidylinositol-3-phosphate 5-kinase
MVYHIWFGLWIFFHYYVVCRNECCDISLRFCWSRWRCKYESSFEAVPLQTPMDAPDKTFADVVKLISSWLPCRSNPDNVSRDFWMPDHSCRVCYNCDTQFTIFNRRHHCRRCGRIFCGKCTSNFIPVSSEPDRNVDEVDKIRVCNFCFKQWEQEIITTLKQALPVLSPSLSETSLFGTKSTIITINNSVTSTVGSYSIGNYQHMAHTSSSPTKCSQDKTSCNMQDGHMHEKSLSTVSNRDDSSIRFGYFTNRYPVWNLIWCNAP